MREIGSCDRQWKTNDFCEVNNNDEIHEDDTETLVPNDFSVNTLEETKTNGNDDDNRKKSFDENKQEIGIKYGNEERAIDVPTSAEEKNNIAGKRF